MKLVVIGTGYIGLVTGVCLAETGHAVYCVDTDVEKINKLNAGILPIYEPGLKEVMDRCVERKRVTFTTDISTCLDKADVVMIAVGTPPKADGSTDLSYVESAAKSIAQHITAYTVIVNKSTVPPHTAEHVTEVISATLKERGVSIPFDVVSNPEFLKEGSSVNDFLKPDRIIIGSRSERATAIMNKLYHPFMLNGHPILHMDTVSAEITKYAANAMLATRISFMNEIANMCEALGGDINEVRRGIGSDPRIGSQFLYAGIGFGGSCFPKDLLSLIHTGNTHGCDISILNAVVQVNQNQKKKLVEKLQAYYNQDLAGKRIAVWGLSFKPRTDDIREAPALPAIHTLVSLGCHVYVYDPVAMGTAKKELPESVTYCQTQYDALEQADALLIFTEWLDFRSPDFDRMKQIMRHPVVMDGRNIFDPKGMHDMGFDYFGIGMGNSK